MGRQTKQRQTGCLHPEDARLHCSEWRTDRWETENRQTSKKLREEMVKWWSMGVSMTLSGAEWSIVFLTWLENKHPSYYASVCMHLYAFVCVCVCQISRGRKATWEVVKCAGNLAEHQRHCQAEDKMKHSFFHPSFSFRSYLCSTTVTRSDLVWTRGNLNGDHAQLNL